MSSSSPQIEHSVRAGEEEDRTFLLMVRNLAPLLGTYEEESKTWLKKHKKKGEEWHGNERIKGEDTRNTSHLAHLLGILQVFGEEPLSLPVEVAQKGSRGRGGDREEVSYLRYFSLLECTYNQIKLI